MNLCLVALALSPLGVGCGKEPPPVVVTETTDFPSPSRDPTDACADLGGVVRVCWGAHWNADDVAVLERPTPAVAVSPLGFRCTGAGAARRCRDRALDAPPFRCDGAACMQRHPRLPDDGEWECAAVSGATICRGGQPPAGIPKGSVDAGFRCGARRGRTAPTGERVCVDFSPDSPPDSPSSRRCRFESEHGLTRICEADPAAHAIGDACDRSHPCVDGTRCVAGRCVPGRPEPSCWVPADCDHGTCRFGTCTEDTP